MPSVFERYDQIFNRLRQIQQDYESAEKRLSAFRFEEEVLRKARIENFKKQLKRIGEYYARIEYFRQLAEKNITSKNVLSLKPLELDFNSLRQDARKIDTDNPNDPYAYRLYVHTRCNEIYLELKQNEFTEKLEKLENGENVAYERLQKQVEQAKKELEDKCARYVKGPEFGEFCRSLIEVHHKFSRSLYDEDRLNSVHNYTGKNRRVAFGAVAQPLVLVGDEAQKTAESLLNLSYHGDPYSGYQYYDRESQSVLMPVEYDSSKELFLDIRTVTSKENRCFKGITNLLLNLITKTQPGNRKLKIHFLDAVHLSNVQLKALRPLENSAVIAKVPQSEDEILESLRGIVSSFPDLDETLQDEDTVKDYNDKVSDSFDKIERKILVLVGYPNAFSQEAKKLVSRIMYNHTRYGITVVSVENIGYGDKGKRDPESETRQSLSENYYHIEMLERKSSTIDRGDEAVLGFRWYEYDYKGHPIPRSFINAIRKDDERESESIPLEYIRKYPLINWSYPNRSSKNRKSIELPYGFNAKSKSYSTINFGGESFAAYLMGASGSGKSTLLHTLITGILRNYHPDDVELWLADFKMAEFSQYIHPLPPHVKYILLDESRELVFDLVDKLTEEMHRRQKYFMNSGEVKKVEDVPATEYMPVIFVILDEFSIMSQVLQDNESYKLKLQNLLAKGRALGIKFIFSSQSYMQGIRGLTNTAKEQIQTRIAMKNVRDEIEGTLELPKFLKTEENTFMIETLPVHMALRKFHKGEDQLELERVNVLYFKGEAREAYKPQRELIDDINAKLRKIERSGFTGSEEGTYVDKHPVIVDGNSYEAFIRTRFQEEIGRYRKENAGKILDDDVVVTFGSPRRMENRIFAELSRESRENILVIARSNEQACAASIVLSAEKCFLLQKSGVQIWAYERNSLYRTYKEELCLNSITPVEGLGPICKKIRELKQKILNGEAGNELIVLLGMDHIAVDFDYVSGSAPVTSTEKTENWKAAETAGLEDEINVKFIMYFKRQWTPKEQQLRAEGKSDAEIKKIRDEEQAAMFGPYKEDYLKKYAAAGQTKAAEQAAKNPPKTDKNDGAYNAKEDFDFVVKHGSRLGYHFIMVLSSQKDVRASGLKIDYFRNRLSFELSKEDALELFGRGSIGMDLPEHVCQLYDTVHGYSFRPYLHKNVDWDGWYTDGKRAIGPLDSNE